MAKHKAMTVFLVLILIFTGLTIGTEANATHPNSGIKSWDAAIRFDVPIEVPSEIAPPPKKPFVMSILELPPRPLPPASPSSSSTFENARVPNLFDGIRGGSIEQDFDHFTRGGPNEGRKWEQRFYYTINASGRPTGAESEMNFLQLDGEWEMSPWELGASNAFVRWAREWNATAHILEHRFYGQSELNLGVDEDSTSKEGLQLLTAEQALADAAVYIVQTNNAMRYKNPKWVVFGGSYAGNLAAWMREKYPELVVGAVASSAPVEAKLDFHEYAQTVDRAFKLYGRAGCAMTIRKYFSLAQRHVHTEAGRRALGICESATGGPLSVRDVQLFMASTIWYLSGAVQYDDPNHMRLNIVCDEYRERVNWLERSRRYPVGRHAGGICTPFNFDDYVKDYPLWKYSSPVDFYLDMCWGLFGVDYDRQMVSEAVKRSNENFGGAKHLKATNVIFINGSEDPWHTLSVLRDKRRPGDGPSPSVQSILIPGTSHCYDMYSISECETNAGVVKAHGKVKEALKKWLA